MRATSVIFLILAVILAFIGVVVCGIGASLAEEQGIALFDEVTDANDNLIYTYNYTGDGIKKIAVEVGECEVNVYGNSETAYIELVNFAQGSYDLSATNLTLSVVDNSNLLKLFSWGSEGINFHGFRHYLKALDFADKPRTINIYITGDSAVKQFDLTVGTGTLSMQDLRFTFDLTGAVEAGSITLADITTTSDITIKAGQGSVSFDTVTSRSLTIEAGTAEVDLDACYTLRGIKIDVAEGDVALDTLRPNFNGYIVGLQAPEGEIDYFGTKVGDGYVSTDSDDGAYTIAITAEKGDITVSNTPAEDEEYMEE